MKIILAQAPVRADQPADNLVTVEQVLTRVKDLAPGLVVFPRRMQSGQFNDEVRSRPGLEKQYQRVWEDFENLSRGFPDIALGTSAFMIDPMSGLGREVAFLMKNAELLFRQPKMMGAGEPPPSQWPLAEIGGRRLRILAAEDLALPGADDGVDVLISLGDRIYRGRPFEPQRCSSGGSWRLNVGAVGLEGGFIREGATTVVSPEGELKAWLGGFEAGLIELDTESKKLPGLPDAGPRDSLSVLSEALIYGLRDFVRRSGHKQVVLGLSGGLDSAVAAVLAVRALGKENVLGVALPSEFNAPESLADARALAKNLGIAFMTLPISAVKDSFLKAFVMAPKSGDGEEAVSLAGENLQPRIRATFLMYLANRENRLLLATSNKSEAAMGYCTLYGDTCGALAPLGDVYKTQVYELARLFNRAEEIIPQNTIDRPPSAELKHGQTDQDSLPPYEVLDDILARHLEGRRSGSQVARESGHSAMTVAWALSALKRNAFKRAQSPPVLVVSPKPLPRI